MILSQKVGFCGTRNKNEIDLQKAELSRKKRDVLSYFVYPKKTKLGQLFSANYKIKSLPINMYGFCVPRIQNRYYRYMDLPHNMKIEQRF